MKDEKLCNKCQYKDGCDTYTKKYGATPLFDEGKDTYEHTNKIPVVLFDIYNTNTILGIVMIPETTNKSEVENIISGIKAKNPDSWDMEEILLALGEHKDWEIYNCQDTLELRI